MENLIKEFLKIKIDGSGYGDGSGSGSGYGSGDGYGDGDGDGDGYGDAYGNGYGDGDAYGSGSGYGDGSGDAYGDGYGDGDGSRSFTPILDPDKKYIKGFLDKKIASFSYFNKKPVYYVDNIPCVFLSILHNVAKILIIRDDFSTVKSYIAKSTNLFAHGETKEKAIQAVQDKFFASLSFEEKKYEFIKMFEKDKKYSNRMFFDWHHFLTGSCESGRLMFVESHSINLDSEMTTIYFLKLTQNEYNGSVISELLNELSN